MTLKDPEKLADAATSTIFSATLLPARISALKDGAASAVRSAAASPGKALSYGLSRLPGRGIFGGGKKKEGEGDAAADDTGPSTDQACVVCLTNPREVRLTACGHVVLCVTCVNELERRKARSGRREGGSGASPCDAVKHTKRARKPHRLRSAAL